MARDIEQHAFVLHRRPYRETSLLVTFFTEQYGKQNAVIKGVRSNSKSAQAKQAWLQPFQGVQISWREKPNAVSDLVSLRSLEPSHIRFPLMGESNLCGLYVNELLYRLLYPALATDGLFQTYQQTLYDLAKADNRSEQAWVLRKFEFELLTELGFAFHLDEDHALQPVLVEQDYWFYPELGLFPKNDNTLPESQTAIPVTGNCLLHFAKMDYCETCLGEWKRLFRQVLAGYLGNKPIQTRALFQAEVDLTSD